MKRLFLSLFFLVGILFISLGIAAAEPVASSECLSCHEDFPKATFKQSMHADLDCVDCHSDIQSADHETPKPVNCASCHEAEGLTFQKTVHGKARVAGNEKAANCQACHGNHDVLPASNSLSKMYRKNVPQTCGACHSETLKEYSQSVHGKAAASGNWDAPVCTSCHGEHTILSHLDPKSSVYAKSISEGVCAQCHAAEKIVSKYRLPADRVKTFRDSYHGMVNKFGVTKVANCASCHSAHKILPSKDPLSTVNKANLPQTCGKCHPSVSDQLAKGTIHVSPESDKVVFWITIFYIFLIAGVLGLMLFHNALDFWRKMKEHYRRKHLEHQRVRFNTSERIQHWLLFLSFTMLAYSGFALKFPDAWWAIPFSLVEMNLDWRGLVHRASAIVFVVLGAYHVAYVLLTVRGRKQLKALMLGWQDLSDFIGVMAFNMGKRSTKPKIGHYGYAEKVEYWALIWGSFVMAATGFVLTFDNFAMRYFPKWVMDAATTIHFYEAVLATLAIVIWHLYMTVYDPDAYPMNLSMTTGKSDHDKLSEEDEKKEEKPKN